MGPERTNVPKAPAIYRRVVKMEEYDQDHDTHAATDVEGEGGGGYATEEGVSNTDDVPSGLPGQLSTGGGPGFASPQSVVTTTSEAPKNKGALVLAAEQIDRRTAALSGYLRKHNSQGRWQKRYFESELLCNSGREPLYRLRKRCNYDKHTGLASACSLAFVYPSLCCCSRRTLLGLLQDAHVSVVLSHTRQRAQSEKRNQHANKPTLRTV